MTLVVLAVLAIVWAVVLGSYAKDRLAGRRHDTVSSFRTQLSTLQRAQPGSAPVGRGPDRPNSTIRCETARCRRRNALFTLAGLAATSLIAVLVAPVVLTVAFAVVSVLALAGYVGLLVQRQRIITEQRAKVRRLDARRRPVIPTPATRRPGLVASSRR